MDLPSLWFNRPVGTRNYVRISLSQCVLSMTRTWFFDLEPNALGIELSGTRPYPVTDGSKQLLTKYWSIQSDRHIGERCVLIQSPDFFIFFISNHLFICEYINHYDFIWKAGATSCFLRFALSECTKKTTPNNLKYSFWLFNRPVIRRRQPG